MNKIIKWFKGLFKTPEREIVEYWQRRAEYHQWEASFRARQAEEDRKRLEYQSQFLGGV